MTNANTYGSSWSDPLDPLALSTDHISGTNLSYPLFDDDLDLSDSMQRNTATQHLLEEELFFQDQELPSDIEPLDDPAVGLLFLD